VDLHACAWGKLAALGHSADLMFINSLASRGRIPHRNTSLNENCVCITATFAGNDRYGSKPDVMLLNFDVPFTPESRHSSAQSSCPLRTTCGLTRCSKTVSLFEHLVGASEQRRGFDRIETLAWAPLTADRQSPCHRWVAIPAPPVRRYRQALLPFEAWRPPRRETLRRM
jgi:hypothetical protein